jgi:hypothetical protein
MKPHRAGIVLALAILGLIFCPLLDIIAFFMAKADLEEIDRGVMDPEGRTLTQAAWVCGIVGMVILLPYLLVVLAAVGLFAFAPVPA